MKELTELFTSRVRVAILRALVGAGTAQVYERELLLRESLPIGGMRRELARLKRLGIVLTRRTARRRYYAINTDHGLYLDLKQLLLKAELLEGHLRSARRLAEKIRVAFIFGSCARGEEDAQSDLDLAVVGSISDLELGELLKIRGFPMGRHVSPLLFPEKEIRQKYRAADRFTREIVDGPKIFLIGRDHDLRGVVEEKPAAPKRRLGRRG